MYVIGWEKDQGLSERHWTMEKKRMYNKHECTVYQKDHLFT